jgi:hypothetical protein
MFKQTTRLGYWMKRRGLRTHASIAVTLFLIVLILLAWLSQNSWCPPWLPQEGPCTTWYSQNQFWSNFYSNLMSTMLGIAFGIPAGLYLNRQTEKGRILHEDKNRDEDFLSLLKIIFNHVSSIHNSLIVIAKLTNDGKLPFQRLDDQVWSSLSPELLSKLPSYGELGVGLAHDMSAFYLANRTIQNEVDLAIGMNYSVYRSYPDSKENILALLDSALKVCLTNIERSERVQESIKKLETQVTAHKRGLNAPNMS